MELTSEQKQVVAEWAAMGEGLSEIQRKLHSEFKITMTFMDVRFIVGDLGVTLKDKPAVQSQTLLTRKAEAGDPASQCQLGYALKSGNGMPKDEAEAVRWFRRAAEQGNAVAQCNLGICLQNGTGIAKDEAEAVLWYRKAAEQGQSHAQYNLGACLQDGTGIVTDPNEALRWFSKAAAQGHSDAQKFIEALKKSLRIEDGVKVSTETIFRFRCDPEDYFDLFHFFEVTMGVSLTHLYHQLCAFAEYRGCQIGMQYDYRHDGVVTVYILKSESSPIEIPDWWQGLIDHLKGWMSEKQARASRYEHEGGTLFTMRCGHKGKYFLENTLGLSFLKIPGSPYSYGHGHYLGGYEHWSPYPVQLFSEYLGYQIVLIGMSSNNLQLSVMRRHSSPYQVPDDLIRTLEQLKEACGSEGSAAIFRG